MPRTYIPWDEVPLLHGQPTPYHHKGEQYYVLRYEGQLYISNAGFSSKAWRWPTKGFETLGTGASQRTSIKLRTGSTVLPPSAEVDGPVTLDDFQRYALPPAIQL